MTDASLQSLPQKGPKLLFFSGGTALREVSRELIKHTHNSIHIITPFDSGGSSAVLRKSFGMGAVGDLRNRLMALADLSVEGNRAMYALFTYRLSKKDPAILLHDELRRMSEGDHVLVSLLPKEKQGVLMEYFKQFLEVMPVDFDLSGASVGNIVLTAGYFGNGRKLERTLSVFAQMAQARGIVRPVVEDDLQLAARLADCSVVVGQHLLTGKEAQPLTSPIEKMWLTESLCKTEPVSVSISPSTEEQIRSAELICYPIGSFYSSVVANLLPMGVGRAVAANPCSKVFTPNPSHDPEMLGQSVTDQVALLREYLVASGAPDSSSVLDTVLVDSTGGEYPGGLDMDALEAMGVKVVDRSLVTEESGPFFDPEKLVEALLSLV